MKKSCNGCRALQQNYDSAGVVSFSCRLGYDIREDTIRHFWGKVYLPVPTEKCPKPRTWREYDNLPNKACTRPLVGSGKKGDSKSSASSVKPAGSPSGG
jgi:hypothetical protein